MRWKSSVYKSKLTKQTPQERLDLYLFSLDLFLFRSLRNSTAFQTFLLLYRMFREESAVLRENVYFASM